MNAARALAILDSQALTLVTTSEAASLWRISTNAATEMLRRLAAAGHVRRIRRGLWARGDVDPLAAIDRLAEPDFAYVSFLTALRLQGLIEQIASDMHIATTGRARKLATPLGRYAFHHIDPAFFKGFTREHGIGLATPEKALIDTLYASCTQDRSFARLPEVTFPAGFSTGRARGWIRQIPSERLRAIVARRFRDLSRSAARE